MNLSVLSLFSVEDKTAVLTGSTGFLGRTMGRALLENGARVVGLGGSERCGPLEKLWKQEFGDHRATIHRCDMYSREALEQTLEQICAQEPMIDILINNAHELGPRTGFNVPDGTFENASFDQWMRNLTAGVYWPALTIQKIGTRMKEQGQGSIINVSTMYAAVAPSPQLYSGTNFVNPPGYSASKAGMMALTRYVASFWGEYGIRCNAILPGPFSNTQDDGPNTVPKDDPFLLRLRNRTCLHRVGKPEEIVGALLYLASDASSYVTGHGLMVDGGWTAT